MEVSDQPHAPAALPPKKNSDTDCIGRIRHVGGLDHSFSIDGTQPKFWSWSISEWIAKYFLESAYY